MFFLLTTFIYLVIIICVFFRFYLYSDFIIIIARGSYIWSFSLATKMDPRVCFRTSLEVATSDSYFSCETRGFCVKDVE